MNNGRIVLIGVRRGWAEHLQFLRNRREMVGGLLGTVVMFVVMVRWQGGADVPGTHASKAVPMAAGFLAFCVSSVALMNLPMVITADREQGALLRLRTIPGGLAAYLVGRAVAVLSQLGTYVVVMLTAGLMFTRLTLPTAPADWLTLVWVLGLGVMAVVPLGAALGALLPGPRNAASVLSLPMTGLLIISGVLFPVTSLPEPVQWVAQAFPLYWQGLGLRSVFLPHSMLAAEIGHSWRPLQTAAVLATWSLGGMILASWLLRRTTRRESGTRLTERQQRLAARSGY